MVTSIEGNNFIKNKIISQVPFIASKMGSVEQSVIISYINGNFGNVRGMASDNAGITPSDDNTLRYFSEEYIKALTNTDILGSMYVQTEETIIKKYCPFVLLSELRLLEPFYFDEPWSEFLRDKNVLVISPFEQTIINQYKNKRDNIFNNRKILPQFNLLTIKAEQTNGGGRIDSKPFIESLNIMKDKMNNLTYDIAIIGCGAYGLLLANHAKNVHNKQAVHIGGGLQIMFGIKGKRWDVHPDVSPMYNEYWVRPSDDEKTLNYNIIEGGTYW